MGVLQHFGAEALSVSYEQLRQQLKIFHGVSARRKNISLNVHPECQDEINDQW